jgi:hypothetical protein
MKVNQIKTLKERYSIKLNINGKNPIPRNLERKKNWRQKRKFNQMNFISALAGLKHILAEK